MGVACLLYFISVLLFVFDHRQIDTHAFILYAPVYQLSEMYNELMFCFARLSSRCRIFFTHASRHTVISSHGELNCQLVTHAFHHTVNSSQVSTEQSHQT